MLADLCVNKKGDAGNPHMIETDDDAFHWLKLS